MPNFIGKLGGFVTSIMSSRDPEATINDSIDGKEIPSLVEDFHSHLHSAIGNGDSTDEILQNLFVFECQKLEDKYVLLRVKDLLELNNKSLQELRNILSGLAFIVKYARHLIKDPQKRSGQWRNIHFSNTYFIKKIKPLNGFEMILEQLGYTERTDYGLRFPLNQEPNKKVVVSLIGDMMLLRKELKEYVLDKHPHKHLLDNILPQSTRDEILAFRLSGLKIEEDSNDVSGQSSITDFDQHHRMSSAFPDSLLTISTMDAGQPDSAQNENTKDTLVKETVTQVWEPVPTSVMHSDVADSPGTLTDTKNSSSEPEKQAIQELVTSTEVADAIPIASGEGSSSSSKRLACSVCGEDATLFCADCANKHLCDNCNKNWHKHPSRQNHRTEPISALNSIASDQSMMYVFDPTYGVCAQISPGHTKISRKQQTFLVDQKNESRKGQTNVPGMTRMGSGSAPFADSFYGPGHLLRKNPSNQPDDYQILDYQRSQQKQQYHFPLPMHSLMDSPYRTLKDLNNYYPGQRIMYPQGYQGPQPLPQHMMGHPGEVPDYVMQQVKDQETRYPYNHPASRNYGMYGHGQQYVQGHANSPMKPGGNNMFQPTLPFFNPQENHNNNYQSNYPVPPPAHGGYMSEFGINEEFSNAYPPPSGFGSHQLHKGFNSGGGGQQTIMGQGSVTSYYQDALESTDAKFIRRLQQEPDFQKRRTKCETYIEDLDMDLKELEHLINEKLLEIDEFCESEAFKEMVRRKKAMMKEKKNLESYRSQLEGESHVKNSLPGSSDILKQQVEPGQQIFYPPDIETVGQASSKQPGQMLALEGYQKNMSGQLLPKNGSKVDKGVSKVSSLVAADISGTRPYQENTILDPSMSTSRTPVENSTEERYGQLESRQAKEIQQLPENSLNRIIPAPKVPLSQGLYQSTRWQCEHCTYINEAGSHVCSICDKTSINPRLFDAPEEITLSAEKFREPSLGDDDVLMNFLRIQEAPGGSDIEIDPDETHVVGGNIVGSQIQVMKEKKRAQREFQKSLEEQDNVLLTSSAQTPATSENQLQGLSVRPKDIQGQKTQQATGFAEEFHTPPSSISQVAIVTKVKDTDNRPSSFEDTLARFNEQKVIDTLKAEGLKLAKLVKLADVEGFDIEAVKVALDFCDPSTTPIDWLRANWKKNVERVCNMATMMGNSKQCNSVGEITNQEAEDAYVSCHGNIREAAQSCVDKRTALFDYLSKLGEFPREEILQCMFQCQGHQENSAKLLQSSSLQQFLDRIWAQKEISSSSQFTLMELAGADSCPSISTSVIGHTDFQRMIKDKNIPVERRIRLILVEGSLKSWGRAELVLKLLDSGLESDVITLEDIVEAVRNCQDRQSAIAYLQQGCQLCFTDFPMSKIRSLNFCQCKMCQECLSRNFEVVIREKHVRHWTCPLCSMPDLNDVDVDVASDYLQFLTMLLQPLIDQDIQNLFETKVRDWHLQKDPNFRWCAHCAEGFLAENRVHQLRMTCPYCHEKTCFNCKKPWEDQHENITCEQFAQWKIDNDPNNQSVGLAKHLDENGIDCPTCKMRFSLAKGGCMHFKCPNCGYEFCSGCNEPYHHKDVCNKFKGCKNQGFHCHCPRDCFSHLRDWSVDRLQDLLKKHAVAFNVKPPDDQQDSDHCPVMEQKEFDMVKRDEKCGKKTVEGQAGLCKLHYKEYLVYLINKNKLDPVVLMTKEEITILAQRYEIKLPQQKANDSVESLIKIIKEKLPLKR